MPSAELWWEAGGGQYVSMAVAEGGPGGGRDDGTKLANHTGSEESCRLKGDDGRDDIRTQDFEMTREDDYLMTDEHRKSEERRRLLKWNDMPPHLQFNPYILTGYRPMLSFRQSLTSLFYLHNETINILTHGIPIVYIVIVVPRSIPWSDIRVEHMFLGWCHVAGALSPWIGSFLYHLFMNMKSGSSLYRRLLQLDMLGIWVTQSFGALPMVCASIYCLPYVVQWLALATYTAFSIFGLYKALQASSPWNRRLCFTLPFLMRNLLTLLRLTRWGGGDPTTIHSVILQDLVSLIGGAIGALNVPERWFPGRLDLYFNSHNIMHVLVVLAVYYMHLSSIEDLLWMAKGSCATRHASVVLSHAEL